MLYRTRTHTVRSGALWTATFALSALAATASAQSLEAFQGDYAGNGSNWTGLNGNGGANNAANPWTDTQSFSGLDSQNNLQTETLNATAYSYASYGSATTYGSGTVTNPYYPGSNPPFYDGTNTNPNGSPDLLSVHGNAGWSDTLTFSGLTSSDMVSFNFQLTGTGSGPIAAGINFFTDSNGGTYYGQSTTSTSASWITPTYSINAGGELGINVDYYGGMTSFTSQMPEGITYTGSFLSTLTLVGIQATDPSGHVLGGWSVTAASGANYAQAVPEPTGIAAIGLGLVGLLLRRRRNDR